MSTWSYSVVQVPSETDPDRLYDVLIVDADEPSEAVCECEGFNFRGTCHHQQEAVDALCQWYELEGPEQQEGSQRRDRTCPRCGGPTEWIVVDDNPD